MLKNKKIKKYETSEIFHYVLVACFLDTAFLLVVQHCLLRLLGARSFDGDGRDEGYLGPRYRVDFALFDLDKLIMESLFRCYVIFLLVGHPILFEVVLVWECRCV